MVKHFPFYCCLLLSVFLGGCAVQPVNTIEEKNQASSEQANHAFLLQIQQIDEFLAQQKIEQAQRVFTQLNTQVNNETQMVLYQYAKAKLAIAADDYTQAEEILNAPQLQNQLTLANNHAVLLTSLLNAQVLAQQNKLLDAAHLRVYLAPLIEEPTQYQENHQTIWQLLNQLSSQDIPLDNYRHEQEMYAWLSLNQLVMRSPLPLTETIAAIEQWKKANSKHPALLWPPKELLLVEQAYQHRAQYIAVILPSSGKYQPLGQAIRDGLIHAWYHSDQQNHLSFYHCDDSAGFINVYQEAVFDGAQLVIGPLFKNQINELLTVGETLPVPTIVLNRIDNQITEKPDNLYEFSLYIDDEIQSLILFAQRKHFSRAIVLHQADHWADAAGLKFAQTWQQTGDVAAIQTIQTTREQAQQIQQVLHLEKSNQRHLELQRLTGLKFAFEPRRRQDIDFIALIARPEVGASIRPLLSFYFAGDIPVLATSSIYHGYNDPIIDNDLSGIQFTDIPFLFNTKNISENYQSSPYLRTFAMGIDAFALADKASMLERIPSLRIQGQTGELAIKDHVVYRQTAYGTFTRGKVQKIKLAPIQKENHDLDTKDRPAL